MIQGIEANVFATLRDGRTRDIRLSRRLARRVSTKKLACMLGGSGLASSETRSCSMGMPQRGLFAHCSREISRAQVTHKGDFLHATLHP